MSQENVSDPTRMVRTLLDAAGTRAQAHRSTSFLLPSAIALANLFICAFFEDSIKADPDGRSLSLFFFVEGIFFFLLTAIHLAGTGAELLRKSMVMPVTPSARLWFAFFSAARNPLLQALLLSNFIFLLIVFHQSAASVILVPFLTALMAADIVALTSVASTSSIRRSRPPTIPAAIGILGVLGILALALLLHMPALPGIIPPMSWTARGIIALETGELGLTLLCVVAGIVLLVLTAILGRRFA